jgi:hypothetical protein
MSGYDLRVGEVLQLRSEGLEWRAVGSDVVVLDLDGGRYFAVNGSGAVLFSSLVDGATRERLSEQLTEKFAIDRNVADGDVESFLATAREYRFLEA